MRKTWSERRSDYLTTSLIFVLIAVGFVMLASASSNLGVTKYGDPYYYVKHQALYGFLPGLAGFFITSRIYYRKYLRFALLLLVCTLVLVSLVFTSFGVRINGATRWVALGPLVFQPSELLKLTFILYVAGWLALQAARKRSFFSGLIPFSIVLAFVGGILIAQPATSTVIILMGTALSMYFVSGAKLRYIALLILGVLGILAIVIYLTPYRLERVRSFLTPSANQETSGYHANQALIAIGSGGITGVGYGKSIAKLKYLPEPIGDSIFAVMAEELGFIGGSIVIAAFSALVIRLLILARRAPDPFGELLLVGFACLIGFQAFMHIGAISGVLPLTGMPLPFMSYGGTALAVFMVIGGVAVNASKHVS
jgi:cell division protein FtsW